MKALSLISSRSVNGSFPLVAAILFVFVFSNVAADCNICGEQGFQVTNFDAEVVLPGQPTRTCQELLFQNEAGAIDVISCNLLTLFTPELCGCVPDGSTTTTTTAPSLPDIVGVAAGFGSFYLLVAALQAANLVEALSDPMGPYTVFAPLDSAFEALPEGVVDALLIPENSDWLTEVILYHLVPGTILSTDFVSVMMVGTLEGSPVAISVSNETGVSVDQATVVVADIIASNGIVHAIDGVLLPSSFIEVLPSIIASLNSTENSTDTSYGLLD
jgi:uncharacterized surface protein with fasciclin (FAS1) repeats